MSLLMTRCSFFAVSILGICVSPILVAQTAPDPPKTETPATTDSGDSLGAVARRTKAQKSAHATKVVTDDDVKASAGPLPHLKMTGAENGEDVVAAIVEYKKNHTPAQTEDAVRRWYEECDDELSGAIKENIEIKNLRETNTTNGYELCQQSQDYQKCEARRRAEMNGARHDQSEINRNNDRIVRIQHSLMSIRNRLLQLGLNYEWFKVRTTNNIDRF